MQEKIHTITVITDRSSTGFLKIKDITSIMPDQLANFTEKLCKDAKNTYSLKIEKDLMHAKYSGANYDYYDWRVTYNRIGYDNFSLIAETDERINTYHITFYLNVCSLNMVYLGSYKYHENILEILDEKILEVSKRYFRRL